MGAPESCSLLPMMHRYAWCLHFYGHNDKGAIHEEPRGATNGHRQSMTVGRPYSHKLYYDYNWLSES